MELQLDYPTLFAVAAVTAQVIAYLTIPSVLLRRSSRPLGQLTWIFTLVAIPYFGVIAWWLWGRTRLEKKQERHQKAKNAYIDALADSAPPTIADGFVPTTDLAIADNEIFPSTMNNSVKLLLSGKEAFPTMLEMISNAEHHVHLEFYIWKDDPQGIAFRDALVERAMAGVSVRVLIDAVGSSSVSGSFLDPLRTAGGEVAVFLPLRLFERRLRINFRNHRKILVVDGTVGFTGGINIGDEYNDWYDAMFGFTGPVVNQLQEVFCEDWFFATRDDLVDSEFFQPMQPTLKLDDPIENAMARVVSSGPDNELELIHSLFFVAITRADHRVWITTPYFVPDGAIIAALRTAVMRGVDVRLLLPGKSDVLIAQWAGRGYFDQLLHAGVKIYEYQPEILHAKQMVIDSTWTIVGSANMDIRSFRLQFEANAAIWSEPLNQQMADLFETQLRDSRQIGGEAWDQRALIIRLVEAAARLFSPQL